MTKPSNNQNQAAEAAKSLSVSSSKKNPSLLGSSAVVATMTMMSRVMGLIRDVVIARLFGASDSADAFFVAFRIPQFLRRLFAEGAFAQAFVPVLADYKKRQQEEGSYQAVKGLIDATAGVLGGTLLTLTVLIVIAAPYVAMVFAPGFIAEPEKFNLTVDMLRITFPYLLFISLTGFAGSILNSYGRFAVPAFTPVLLNLSLIFCAVFLADSLSQPVMALAYAVLIAGMAQLLFQLPFLRSMNLIPIPKWDTKHAGVRRIMTLMLPAIFGVSVSQLNLLLDTVLASFLPSGSVSWLYYSDRLVELPLGVFGIAIATVVLPSLSALNAGGSGGKKSNQLKNHFVDTLDWALALIVLIAAPATVALLFLAEPILFLLFQYDQMLPSDVAMAALSLRAYAVGLLAFMAIKVLATGYYSQQDTKTPVRIGIIAMVSNMVLNLIFVWLFHRYGQIGHVGLALATSASAWLNAALLYRGLNQQSRRDLQRVIRSRNAIFLGVRSLIACAVMLLVLVAMPFGTIDLALADFGARAYVVSAYCVGGVLVYAATLWIFGFRPSHVQIAHYASAADD